MLTVDVLREILDYDPMTGVFRWRQGRKGIRAGGVAGSKKAYGYVEIGLLNGQYLAHRLAWLFVHGVWPADQIDHIDGDRSNNCIANLREATRSENLRNRGLQRNNTSGFKGVIFDKRTGMWQARIKIHGRRILLGLHETPEAAHAAYCEAAAKHHGEFAKVA